MDELRGVLEELEALLRRHGESFWADEIAACAGLLRAQDAAGAARFREACGGMSSFNDLVLHPENGHAIAEADVDAVDAELRRLRARAWRLAR